MPLALIADLIKAQIVSMDVAAEAIQAATETIATEAATLDTAVGTLKDEVVTMDVALGTLKDDVALIKADVASALNKMVEGAPTGGTPFTSVNAAAVTTDGVANAQVLEASPGAGNHLCVNEVHFYNITAAEVAVLQLIEDGADAVMAGPFSVGDPAVSGKGYLRCVFKQPIKLPTDTALEVSCIGTVGDSYAIALGYAEAD